MALTYVERRSVPAESPQTAAFSKENFELLRSIMQPVHAAAGTYLFWEGDPAEKMYYIHSGRVKLRKSTEDGKDLTLSIRDKGDFVGVFSLSDSHHTYSAEVVEDLTAGMISMKDLRALLSVNGHLAVEYMNWLGLMSRAVQSKFRDLLLFGKPGALASTLIRLSTTYGVACAEGIRIDIKLTNTEIADLIGTARESVNRMLNSWKEEGIIGFQNGHIVIKNMDHLRKICRCPAFPRCPKEICRI